MLKDGVGGKALFNGNVKICDGYKSNWFERLQTALSQKDRDLVVVTYSLPNIDREAVQNFMTKRKGKTVLVYNSKFDDNPQLRYFHDFDIKLIPMNDCHAKMALISPDTVHIGSENFAFSSWFESCVTIKNKTAYEYQLRYLSEYLGFNPFTDEKVQSCYNCRYFGCEYNEEIKKKEHKCNLPQASEITDGLEKGCCEHYDIKPRREYIKYHFDTPWKFTCKECVRSQQVFTEQKISCGWYCPVLRKFTERLLEDTPIECGFFEKRR